MDALNVHTSSPLAFGRQRALHSYPINVLPFATRPRVLDRCLLVSLVGAVAFIFACGPTYDVDGDAIPSAEAPGRAMSSSVDAAADHDLDAGGSELVVTTPGTCPRVDAGYVPRDGGPVSCSQSGANFSLCATATASSSYPSASFRPSAAIDGVLGTSWYAAAGICEAGVCPDESVFLEVAFDQPRTVGLISIRGNRDFPSGYDVLSARIVAMDANRRVLSTRDVATTRGAEPNAEAQVVLLPAAACVSYIRVIALTTESANDPGFAEIEAYAN